MAKKKSPKKSGRRKKQVIPEKLSAPPDLASRKIVKIPLDQLHLDSRNPRFGLDSGNYNDQTAILDFIVDQYGIQTVISSLAVNGYFQSEPILVRRDVDSGQLVVAEGNRRLAACLVLAGDPRAINQKKRHQEFRKVQQKYGNPPITHVPTVIFETEADLKELMPYLGVRHIVGAQQWDSYAKASWVAQAIEKYNMSLEDVIHMIGDDTRLAEKMLEGFYIVQQLIDEGLFEPELSVRKGSRSSSEFPFSWVYTAIGFKNVRKYLELDSPPHSNPLNKKGLEKGSELFQWMFGQGGEEPVIKESRELRDLAVAISDDEKRSMFRQGFKIQEVQHRTRPPADQISDALTRALESLGSANKLLAEGNVSSDDADRCIPLSGRVRSSAIKVYRELNNVAGFAEDEDG